MSRMLKKLVQYVVEEEEEVFIFLSKSIYLLCKYYVSTGEELFRPVARLTMYTKCFHR